MIASTIGLDLTKHHFHVHVVDAGVIEIGEVIEEAQFALSECLGESCQKEPSEQA